jgi:hypothetical protein
MPRLVPGIHVLMAWVKKAVDGRAGERTTPFFGRLCPAMTENG